jgi:hypothetical protein
MSLLYPILTTIEILIHCFEPSHIIMCMRYNVDIYVTIFSQLTCLEKSHVNLLRVGHTNLHSIKQSETDGHEWDK